MIGIPAAATRCTTDLSHTEGEIRVLAKVQDVECSAAGSWVIAQCGAGSVRWVGRAEDGERLERGQEVAMLFNMEQTYWFDGPTGRTLFAPKG